MRLTVGILVTSDDLAAIVDRPGIGPDGAGDVNPPELASAVQKAMTRFTHTWQDNAITSDDVTGTVNPQCVGEDRAGRTDRSERALAQQEPMPSHRHLARKPVKSHDVAARVDPRCTGQVRAREIYRGELAMPVSQKAVVTTVASTDALSDNLAG